MLPLLPSAEVTSLMLRLAASSLVMVPLPVASAIVAPLAPERLTEKVSVGSTRVSPVTWTVTDLLVSPTAKFSVPLAAV